MTDRSDERLYILLTEIQVVIGLICNESFRFWIFHFLIFTILVAILIVTKRVRRNHDSGN